MMDEQDYLQQIAKLTGVNWQSMDSDYLFYKAQTSPTKGICAITPNQFGTAKPMSTLMVFFVLSLVA